MTLVYRHRRLDTHEVFYIGIGSKYRAYNTTQRTEYWKRVVNKAGYVVEIIAEDLEWDAATELECFLIEEYGRKDLGKGCLINMTDGGEGTPGRILSKKHIERLKEFNLGKVVSKETREKYRQANLGKKLSEEEILKRTLSSMKLSKYKKGTSKYRGVSWCKKKNKWRATIHMEGKAHHLGYFESEDKAHEKYQEILNQKRINLINKK